MNYDKPFDKRAYLASHCDWVIPPVGASPYTQSGNEDFKTYFSDSKTPPSLIAGPISTKLCPVILILPLLFASDNVLPELIPNVATTLLLAFLKFNVLSATALALTVPVEEKSPVRLKLPRMDWFDFESNTQLAPKKASLRRVPPELVSLMDCLAALVNGSFPEGTEVPKAHPYMFLPTLLPPVTYSIDSELLFS